MATRLPSATPTTTVRRDPHSNAPGDPALPESHNIRTAQAYGIGRTMGPGGIQKAAVPAASTAAASTASGSVSNNESASQQIALPLSPAQGGTGLSAPDFKSLLAALTVPNSKYAEYNAGDSNYTVTAVDELVYFTLVSTPRTATLDDWATMWEAGTGTGRGYGQELVIAKFDTTGTPLTIVPKTGTIGFNGAFYGPSPGPTDPKLQIVTAGTVIVRVINGGFFVCQYMAGES